MAVMVRPADGRIGEWTGLDPSACFGVALFRLGHVASRIRRTAARQRSAKGSESEEGRVMASGFVVGVVSGENGERVLLAAVGLVWER